jgi:uncharacterized protein (TIGR02118 family)
MLKVMLLMKRKPGLSLAEFIEHYESVHVPLAEKRARGLLHYERHYLHPSPKDLYGNEVGEPEYDVLTELWYEDRQAFEKAHSGLQRYPERIADIVADEERLFDRAKSRVVFVEDRISDLGVRARRVDLEHDVRRLVDKSAIVDLVHRYSHCVDHRLHDELMELFTEDCVVDYGPGVGPPVHGRGALRAMFGGGDGRDGAKRGFVATSHHNANVLVTFETDDRASVRTSVYAWHQTPQGATPQIWGCYHDVAVRTAGGWRLAERQLRVAGSEQWPGEWHPLTDTVATTQKS